MKPKVKVTMSKYGDNLVNKIKTKSLIGFKSNLANIVSVSAHSERMYSIDFKDISQRSRS